MKPSLRSKSRAVTRAYHTFIDDPRTLSHLLDSIEDLETFLDKESQHDADSRQLTLKI